MRWPGKLRAVVIFLLLCCQTLFGNNSEYFVRTYAGYTSSNYMSRGNGDSAFVAIIEQVKNIHIDTQNNYYIAESTFIRKITSVTNIISVCGGGGSDSSSNNIAATLAAIPTPWGIAGDSAGNIYYGDSGLCCVRKIATASTLVSTVVGVCGTCASDLSVTIAGTSARLNVPRDMHY